MAWLVVCYAKTQPKASKASTASSMQTPINELRCGYILLAQTCLSHPKCPTDMVHHQPTYIPFVLSIHIY